MSLLIEEAGHCTHCRKDVKIAAQAINHPVHLFIGFVCWPWFLAWTGLSLLWAPKWECEKCGTRCAGPKRPEQKKIGWIGSVLFLLILVSFSAGFTVGKPRTHLLNVPDAAGNNATNGGDPNTNGVADPSNSQTNSNLVTKVFETIAAPREVQVASSETIVGKSPNPFLDPNVPGQTSTPDEPLPKKPLVEPTPMIDPDTLRGVAKPPPGIAIADPFEPKPRLIIPTQIDPKKSSGVPVGLDAKTLQEYLDARARGNIALMQNMIKNGGIIIVRKPMDVTFERKFNGFSYVRPFDGPFVDRLVVVQPDFITSE